MGRLFSTDEDRHSESETESEHEIVQHTEEPFCNQSVEEHSPWSFVENSSDVEPLDPDCKKNSDEDKEIKKTELKMIETVENIFSSEDENESFQEKIPEKKNQSKNTSLNSLREKKVSLYFFVIYFNLLNFEGKFFAIG